VVIQHPREEQRPLATVPLLRRVIGPVHVIRKHKPTRGFSKVLDDALLHPEACMVLFPGAGAVPVHQGAKRPEWMDASGPHAPSSSSPKEERKEESEEKPREGRGGVRTLVVIDGTWEQCKKMVCWNHDRLQACPQVELQDLQPSAYTFRRQPTAFCLSTLEAVGRTITAITGSDLHEKSLLRPLEELCRQQHEHIPADEGPKEHYATRDRLKRQAPLTKSKPIGNYANAAKAEKRRTGQGYKPPLLGEQAGNTDEEDEEDEEEQDEEVRGTPSAMQTFLNETRLKVDAGRGQEALDVAGLQAALSSACAADNGSKEEGSFFRGSHALLVGLCLAGIGGLAYTQLSRRN